jgi:hypothetical protein
MYIYFFNINLFEYLSAMKKHTLLLQTSLFVTGDF